MYTKVVHKLHHHQAAHPLPKDISFTLASELHTTKLRIDPQSNLTTTNLIATGNVTVNGDAAAHGSSTATALKSEGTPGLKVRSTADTDIVQFRDSGTAKFYSNVNVGGTLCVARFFDAKP